MSSRKETERTKMLQDKCQTLLTQMLRDEDNKYCVDCDAKGPRWASWNLGIFLCIRCAGIHRNLGVHISRVKSVNLDSWTPEQVVSLQQMGNSRARAVYEALLPDGFRRPQTDHALESFIRAKYEHKKYLAREWVAPPPTKVDWDKEIDEELEKQKRKKKTSSILGSIPSPAGIDKKSISIKAIPAPLSKPKSSSSSPKISSRTDTSAINSDLLGLSSPTTINGPPTLSSTTTTTTASVPKNDDVFSSFLSAPPAAPTNNTTTTHPTNNGIDSIGIAPVDDASKSLAKEEADFFNQVVPNEKEKARMTKDSILALYGAAPTSTAAAIGSMMPNAQFPPQPVSAFSSFPTTMQQTPYAVNGGVGGPTPFAQLASQNASPFATASGNPSFFGGQFQSMVPTCQTTPQQNMLPQMHNLQQQQQQPNFANFASQPAFHMAPAGGGMPQMSVGGGIMTSHNMAGIGQPIAPAAQPPNLSQQFGTLNLGNVWQ